MNMMYSPSMVLTSTTMFMSTLMALSSANWILLWVAMEINMLSFIPILLQFKGNQETEGAIKYFLAQALGSSLLLMSSMSLWMSFTSMPNMITIILIAAVLLKLGAVPCHFWYPSVMSSISWIPCLILSTWQKLAPLSIMAFLLMSKSSFMLTYLAGLNALVGGMMGMNQSQMRTIMAYSSIGHVGWMMSLISVYKPNASIIYFTIYSMLIMPLFIILWNFNINTPKQMTKLSPNNMLTQITIMLLLMSLGGLPPLTGFVPKLMTIMIMVESTNLIMYMLILGSMMNLFFYLNIIINLMMVAPENPQKKHGFNKMMKPTTLSLAMISLMLSPLIIMLYAMIMFY